MNDLFQIVVYLTQVFSRKRKIFAKMYLVGFAFALTSSD